MEIEFAQKKKRAAARIKKIDIVFETDYYLFVISRACWKMTAGDKYSLFG